MSNDDFQKKLGARIRNRRTQLRMSQETLAKLIGKNQDSISGYETGSRGMRVAELPLLAKALQVSVNYFIAEDDVDMMRLYIASSSRLRNKLEDIFYAAIKIEMNVVEMLSQLGIHDDELSFKILELVLFNENRNMSQEDEELLKMWQKFNADEVH
jgi:transcriptional regulator with XRE-family HTH domain